MQICRRSKLFLLPLRSMTWFGTSETLLVTAQIPMRPLLWQGVSAESSYEEITTERVVETLAGVSILTTMRNGQSTGPAEY